MIPTNSLLIAAWCKFPYIFAIQNLSWMTIKLVGLDNWQPDMQLMLFRILKAVNF